MVDSVSLAALSAAALSQGVGFLYGQLGELLRRRRERRAQGGAGAVEMPPATEAAQALDGPLVVRPVNAETLERHADQLAALRGLLHPYFEGDRPVDPGNRQLVEQVDVARALLEQIYEQHITLQGERRPATGTALAAQAGDLGQYARQVIASGERAVAIGGDLHGSTVITGDRTVGPESSGGSI